MSTLRIGAQLLSKRDFSSPSNNSLGAALLEEAAAPQSIERFTLERQRRSTNESSSTDEENTGISNATATFVLNLVVNVAYIIYNLVLSDFGSAANYALGLISIVFQYVVSSL